MTHNEPNLVGIDERNWTEIAKGQSDSRRWSARSGSPHWAPAKETNGPDAGGSSFGAAGTDHVFR